MIVSNRKLFKKRPARDNLNQAAGIMASSPELMGEVQGFDNGGNVQLPGSVGSIVQMLDAINSIQLPQITVSGRRGPNELARQRSIGQGVVISETPVRGYEIFAQDVTLTKSGYYRTWISIRLPLGKFNKMYNYTIEQAVDAYNLNDESKKAWENLKNKSNDDNSL